jgi:hypothetical protein
MQALPYPKIILKSQSSSEFLVEGLYPGRWVLIDLAIKGDLS